MARPSEDPQRRVLATVLLLGVPNLVGAVLVFVFQNLLAPGRGHGTIERELWTFVGYLAVALPVAGVLGYLLLRPVRRWVAEEREPSPEELESTLRAPRRIAGLGFAFWLGALAVFGSIAVADGDPLYEIARDGIATVLGGVTTALLAFLLVETWLRPTVARALAGRAPPAYRSTGGIAPRILLSWGLGSGVPLLAIVMAHVRPNDALPPPTPEATVFLAALALGSGALLLALAAKSVAQPLAAVRAALRRVQDGDVDVEVVVDDAGQIGQLQAGVNEMVRGLRERRRLEDLFGRYVGPEVAAEALARGTDLGGEERCVSALFVDVIASTEFAHERDPGEVVATLNDFFGAVVSVVRAEGGWVNKFEGDGALCVFGAPVDQPDHPTRALRAARLLRDALADVGSRRPSLRAAIGVSTGEVVAGHVGAVERFEYTVIGDAVNEAARLTEAAKGVEGCVLASGGAVAAADPAEAGLWSPAGTLTLRGRRVSTSAWAPVPAARGRGGSGRSAAP